MTVFLILALVFSIILTPANADIITLKTGKTYEGIIGAQDDETILLSVPGQMPLKIRRSSIESITKGRPKPKDTIDQSVVVDDLKFLSCRAYYRELRKALKKAKKSIRVMMYFSYRTGHSRNPATNFLNDIEAASRRGVDVKIIFETSHEEIVNKGNMASAEWLDQHGIEVRFFPIFPVMHVKLVLIDDKISFVGSHNWTSSAIYYNVESSVLIRCSRVARVYREYFKRAYQRSTPYRKVKARGKGAKRH